MAECRRCHHPIEAGARFCPHCGSPQVEPSTTATQTAVPRRTPPGGGGPGLSHGVGRVVSSGSGEGSRFLPGEVVADRYRVVGLLGKGGMGEVYRADDMKLEQSVALKFLPEALERDDDRLQRFLNEVRIARQVSHANVCRVYDIGEVGGQHFLSMEFVDGEDLATLLRRIGRLEHDKAVEIARQICAGLAAAHKKGIVHRDLKPANIMLDGEGQVRITDFGLAGWVDGITGAEVRAGTPDYMAPEQISGEAVSLKSDLYSLGLVLYELFTGRRAYQAATLAELKRLRQSTVPASPSTLISGFDPVVEQVIDRCLMRNPDDRPSSALAVAAALPGGDPLAAALAAGETPSPEMVAAAGPQGGLTSRAAAGLLGFVVAGIVALGFLIGHVALPAYVDVDKSASVLAENARELLAELGHDARPRDRIGQFSVSMNELQEIAKEDKSLDRWDRLANPSQRALTFGYRQSGRMMTPANVFGVITPNDPTPKPGDAWVQLSLDGSLLFLTAQPPEAAFEPPPDAPPDWGRLFRAAGISMDEFREVPPTLQPRVYSDHRAAWVGTPDGYGKEVRIEAASAAGLPVYFDIVEQDDPRWSAETLAADESGSDGDVAGAVVIGVLLLILAGAVLMAIHNARIGRGDPRGAMRIALFVFVLAELRWVASAHHVPSFGQLLTTFGALASSLLIGATTWVLYMALEPYARRYWPQVLVAWSRLVAGRLRDPLVGRDLLIGFACGIVLLLLQVVGHVVPGWFGQPAPPPQPWGVNALAGGRFALGQVFLSMLIGLAAPLGYTLFVLVIRIVFRKQLLADIGAVLIFAALGALQSVGTLGGTDFVPALVIGLVLGALGGLFIVTLILRFGMLAALGCFLIGNLLATFPTTFDFDRPYAGTTVTGFLVVFGLVGWAFYLARHGRPMLAGLMPER